MKKKKSKLVYTIMVIASFITSCSSELDTEKSAFYTPQEKADIENLAEEYGLCFKFTRGSVRQMKSMTEFEKEFERMSRIIGEYELYPDTAKDNLLTLCSYNKKSFSAPLGDDNNEEYGSYKDDDTFGSFNFKIEVKWPLFNYNPVPPTFTVEVENNEMLPGVAIISDRQCFEEGTFVIFSCDICYRIDYEPRVEYFFTIMGNYNKATNMGSFSINGGCPWPDSDEEM